MSGPFRRLKMLAVVTLAALALAACGGGAADGDDAAAADDADAGGGAASMLEVVGTNELRFEPDQLTAAAGEITVELTARPAIRHTFVVEEADDQLVVEVEAGQTATGTIDLEAGTYTFYCSVPGHRAAGMEGTLTVE